MLDHATAMPWIRFVVLILLLVSTVKVTDAEWNVTETHQNVVEFWANNLGRLLNKRCLKASQIEELQNEYDNTQSKRKIQQIDGMELVSSTAKEIEDYLQIRYTAAKRIKKEAEKIYQSYMSDNYTCDNLVYYNSKTMTIYKSHEDIILPETLDENTTYTGPNVTNYLPLSEEWKKYYEVPISLNASAIHVPTNIYNCSPPVLDNISWSESLDDTFTQNWADIPSAWQYFASSSGFMRFFPAAKWNYDGMDMYDARLTEWYTGAASTPKSVVILLDTSGSMTGLRMEIAKTTVKKIMESLQENDFFNVIIFNNDTSFVDCDCLYSNGTLIQATSRNIRRISDGLMSVESSEMANFTKALSVAFELLIQANQSQLTGAASNNAVMVVTDGAPQPYEDVFKKYNWENVGTEEVDGEERIIWKKWARVFTYLIGQEVTLSNKDHVYWMACSNKGYFYHIGTMADVHDYVQDYVRLMARPLVVGDSDHYTWTGLHVNTPLTNESNAQHSARSTDWIRLPIDASKPMLSISVALPVYDLREEERNNGNLLGVAGVDMNLDEVLDLVPQEKLGVLGYKFIINNNGFVVWHPDFSPWVEPCATPVCALLAENDPRYAANKPRPDYKNVDIQYLEQEEDPSQGNIARLRMSMIAGSSGNIKARVKKFYSKYSKKIYIQSQTYYYAPISNTPYSIAIVRVEPMDSVMVYTDMAYESQPLEWCRLVLPDWNYCGTSQELMQSTSPRQRLEEALMDSSCDQHTLARSVFYDTEVTRSLPAEWLRLQQASPSDAVRSCEGVADKADCEFKRQVDEASNTLQFDMVIVGTRSGVTRYHSNIVEELDMAQSGTCTKVQKTLGPSYEAAYFQRAATADRKDIWIFEVNPAEYPDNSTLTVSKGVYIENEEILAAAVGLSITYDSFYQMMNMSTQLCRNAEDCKELHCFKDDLDCFLLDENGYVIFSEDSSQLNKSFADIDHEVLRDMSEQGMFKEMAITDYQALCTICKYPSDTSSASILLDPFRYLSKILWWYITKAALFFIEFNIYDIWHCLYYATALSPNISLSEAPSLSNESQQYVATEWHTVLHMPDFSSSSSSQLDYCRTCKVHRNSTIENLGIETNNSFTEITFMDGILNLTEVCEIRKVCVRSYIAHRVAHTNLYLLVLESNCRCGEQYDESCIVEEELDTGCSGEVMDRYREPPIHRYGSSQNTIKYSNNQPTKYEEEQLTCGGRGSTLSASVSLVTLLIVMVCWINR